MHFAPDTVDALEFAVALCDTDPGATRDFQAFAKQTGNELLEHSEQDKVFTFYMRRR